MATALVIVVIRLLVPLAILRWPFWGAVASIAADALDIVIITLLQRHAGFPDVWSYHEFDKYLDTYYLTIEVIVAQRWPDLPRWIASSLFIDRLIGVVLFELTEVRLFLFLFPALLDFFFLFYAGCRQYVPDYELTPKRLFVWLGILLVPKLIQEYVIHYARLLDDVVAVDVMRDIWDGLTGWLGAVRIPQRPV